ncbi:SDR family NAD(P)-dependent oxidoreductase [Alteromonadaceae bacterium BrNp21-10]|nr:SDR family NAD(P)-dependent oxidoreductase [Alteromonadaceae bacterium BrNp21-10]
MELKHKRIVITGGTSGIGLEVVKALEGDNEVIVIARDQHKLDDLEAQYAGVTTYCCDLSQINEVLECISRIAARYSHIDMLINNAAIQYPAKFIDKDFDPATIAIEINTNFTAVCLLTHGLLPLLQQSSEGRIVNVNTGLALAPKSASAVYCATKAAMHSFSQSLHHQLQGTPVKVTQAFMPLVDTPMTAGRGSKKISAAQAVEEMLNGIRNDVRAQDIGKVKLLRWLLRLAPNTAKKIMVNA